ncbi:hypothetical protein ACKWTF_015353 [Chironomus riparius]
MEHIFFAVCSLIFLFNIQVESINIDCVYHSGDFSHSLKGPSNYFCRVNNLNLVSNQDLVVGNITGSHLSNKMNANVLAFQVYTGTAYYCLKGVEEFFKNIIGLAYQQCHLKEIHKEDLKPFPKIIDLYLNNNDIEVIEEGLLDYNPDLILVYLLGNKITQIHANVFDHLSKMTHLYLSGNTCVVKDATDAVAAKAVIEQFKSLSLCQSVEFLNFEAKLNILENNLKPMNSTSFKIQLENLKNEFKYSKYTKYSKFDDRLENLKIANYVEHCKNQTGLIEKLYRMNIKPSGLEDSSNVDDNLTDFQNKIDALSSKSSSVAEIVEQLEDKLRNMFKKVNFKVTVDV